MNQQSKSTRLIKPSFVRNDQRGLFVEMLNEGPWETVIHGAMKAGSQMGKHYHKENKAFFFLVSGAASVFIKHLVDGKSETIELTSGYGIYFYPFEVHTIEYKTDSTFIFLKSYRYRDDAPDTYVE